MKKTALMTLALALMAFPALAIDAQPSHTLDISQYKETFSETFRGKLDVTPWGPSKWIAHTPWAGDFGDAQFADPQPGFPFITGPGGLKITARKTVEGKWKSGLLSSVDSKGDGFAQVGGYFEARMKLPAGPGVWPAFWLVSPGDDQYKSEIDIIEYYGKFTDNYHVNTHLWPKAKDGKAGGDGKVVQVPDGSLTSAYHTYGAEITDKDVVFYLDRHEVARLPATAPMQGPMMLLVNLALGSGWPIDQTPNPSILQVDYVKAFKKK